MQTEPDTQKPHLKELGVVWVWCLSSGLWRWDRQRPGLAQPDWEMPGHLETLSQDQQAWMTF